MNQLYVPDHPEYNGGSLSSSGIVGSWGTERGLTFYNVQLAGHGESNLSLKLSSRTQMKYVGY